MYELETIAPDWPKLPSESACRPDEDLMAREEWPALDLAWWGIRAVCLEADRGTSHITTALLQAEGALAPLVIVGLGPAPGSRFRQGWHWRCRVHVIGAHCEPPVPVNADCTEQGRSTTEGGARDAGRQHVIQAHPDAAVPYVARRWHALRTWN